MALVAEYLLACSRLPLTEVAAAVPERTLHVEVGQPNQGGPPTFFVASEGCPAPLEAALESAAFVSGYDLVGRRGATRQYQVVTDRTMEEQLAPAVEDLDRLRRLARNRSSVRRVVARPEGWRQTRWFADRAAFEEYVDFWRSNGQSFALHRLTDPERRTPGGGAGSGPLTDRQRDAVLTAHEMGYFAVPRGASLSDVADELGITPSSLSERLRRAQAALVEAAVEPNCTEGELKGPHDWESDGARPAPNG